MRHVGSPKGCMLSEASSTFTNVISGMKSRRPHVLHLHRSILANPVVQLEWLTQIQIPQSFTKDIYHIGYEKGLLDHCC